MQQIPEALYIGGFQPEPAFVTAQSRSHFDAQPEVSAMGAEAVIWKAAADESRLNEYARMAFRDDRVLDIRMTFCIVS